LTGCAVVSSQEGPCFMELV